MDHSQRTSAKYSKKSVHSPLSAWGRTPSPPNQNIWRFIIIIIIIIKLTRSFSRSRRRSGEGVCCPSQEPHPGLGLRSRPAVKNPGHSIAYCYSIFVLRVSYCNFVATFPTAIAAYCVCMTRISTSYVSSCVSFSFCRCIFFLSVTFRSPLLW